MKSGKASKRKKIVIKIMRIAIIPTILLFIILSTKSENINHFNADRAYDDVAYQLSLGPRIIGSSAHDQFINWAAGELNKAGWEAELQTYSWAGEQLTNIIGTRNSPGNANSWIILGAHYDSRFIADRDPEISGQQLPVPGANDGASGVAILLEIARSLPAETKNNVEIVLFDAEDNGNIPGWEWIIGSRVYVSRLTTIPEAVVIVDMVGDADLNLYFERNSDEHLASQIWEVANDLGYHQFIPEYKHQILDDHSPFLEAGIPAVDIIDFDYPYWHTTQDTLDKISPNSLDAVGEVLLAWLQGY